MKNKDLKKTYDQMHEKGPESWFDDGREERQAILEMGQPWTDKTVLEIGCGEGDLSQMIFQNGAYIVGIDYSEEAIKKADEKYPYIKWGVGDYKNARTKCDILVLQGVMEHLDNPFTELADMIERFKPKTVITSMPAFLNIRGIIWHTLDMLGAVMSKTDLHFIDRWEVEQFCEENGYILRFANAVEMDWGNGEKMVEDLRQRIPLALRDGSLSQIDMEALLVPDEEINKFLEWLEKASKYFQGSGAVNIYRIDL